MKATLKMFTWFPVLLLVFSLAACGGSPSAAGASGAPQTLSLPGISDAGVSAAAPDIPDSLLFTAASAYRGQTPFPGDFDAANAFLWECYASCPSVASGLAEAAQPYPHDMQSIDSVLSYEGTDYHLFTCYVHFNEYGMLDNRGAGVYLGYFAVAEDLSAVFYDFSFAASPSAERPSGDRTFYQIYPENRAPVLPEKTFEDSYTFHTADMRTLPVLDARHALTVYQYTEQFTPRAEAFYLKEGASRFSLRDTGLVSLERSDTEPYAVMINGVLFDMFNRVHDTPGMHSYTGVCLVNSDYHVIYESDQQFYWDIPENTVFTRVR